jgi:hypothetical protein
LAPNKIPLALVATAIKTGLEVKVKRLRHRSIDHATHLGGGQRVKACAEDGFEPT